MPPYVRKVEKTLGFGDSRSKGYQGIRSLWQDRDLRRSKGQRWSLDEIKAIRADKALHIALIADFQAGVPGTDEKLIRVNYGFLRNTVHRFRKRVVGEFSDLLQEAKLGLLEGCARFDVHHTHHPWAYITHYVRHHVRRSIMAYGCVVHRPSTITDGRDQKVQIEAPKRYVFTFTEMSSHWYGDTEYHFEDTLTYDGPSADEELSVEELAVEMQRLLLYLLEAVDERERKILRQRFAAEVGRASHAIGEELGISGVRVRQLQERALGKCRMRARIMGADPFAFRTFEEWVVAAVHTFLRRDSA
jgi:RNA polymerase sigma factor (sigma-70 family)